MTLSLGTAMIRQSMRLSAAGMLRPAVASGAPRMVVMAKASGSSNRSYATKKGDDLSNDPKANEDFARSLTNEEQAEKIKAKPVRSAASAFDVDTSELVAAADEAKQKQTGARSRGSRASSQEKSRKMTGRILGVASLAGIAFIIQHLGRDWDTAEEHEKYGKEGENNFFGRFSARLREMYTSVKAPVWEKLLPDPLPFPYARPYTLVLDVDDLLIHSEWSRQHAWRTAKRPGLDYFLGYLSLFYEIVLFSRQPMYIVAPVIEKLDPDMRMISFTLFRESCRMLDNGDVVKDLSHLNRDLSKVIAIDTDPAALQMQPENAIILNPWKGDPKDHDLVGLIPFLEAVNIYNIPDVRQTLKAYEGTHIPTEHIKRQKMLREAEEENWRRKHDGKQSWLGSIFGATSGNKEMPKTWYELEQERLRQAYQEEQKFWQENGEKFRQQAKEEQEKKLKEMKLNAWGFITGAAMQAPPGQADGAAQQPPAATSTAS